MTIAEIAKLAGVSSAAVSRYFNNGYLSEEKKSAIEKVVKETGYRPSLQAANLRTKKTKMIGVIIPKLNSTSTDQVIEGILKVLEVEKYHTILAFTQNDPAKEIEYLSMMNEKQVDGLVFVASVFTAKHLKVLKQVNVPIVIVGQSLNGYNCIYHDDYEAFYDITRLVIEKGKRCPTMLSVFQEDKAVGYYRYQGFVTAMKDAGIEDRENHYVVADFTIEGGYEKVKLALEQFPDTDALICATDETAIGALRYLNEQGYSVPGDILLTGHGDTVMTTVTSPSITTIHFDYVESGIIAARILMDIIRSDDDHKPMIKSMKLGYRIVEHDSTNC